MILGFNRRFEPVLPVVGDGTKIHTMREDKKNRWKPGIKIHMAFGVRTRNYWCFNDQDVCKSDQKIEVRYKKENGERLVIIDGHYFYCRRENLCIYGFEEMKQLAKNDGFESVEDFFKWFNKDATLKIIHWTDFRY